MEKVIDLKTIDLTSLLGVGDAHLKLVEKATPATIISRGDELKILGDGKDVELAHEVIHEMIQTLTGQGSLTIKNVKQLITLVKAENGHEKSHKEDVVFYGKKGVVSARTDGQGIYKELVEKNDIVFSIGPAGTGKTFMAVAFAVAALENNEVDRIVLSRPAVEAGESLGFLPGDLKEKVDPYLTPLYDALGFMFSRSKLRPLLEKKVIEIVPLAYMRGRTLDNAYMILDEAQNATAMQMKMFLTRIGINSRAIVTGDITQVDLPKQSTSGLIQVAEILKDVEGIGFVQLNDSDVVRHPLVRKIIKAYDKKKY